MRKCSEPTPVCKHIRSSGGWRLIGAHAGVRVCLYFWGWEGAWQSSFCSDASSASLKILIRWNQVVCRECLPSRLRFPLNVHFPLLVPLKGLDNHSQSASDCIGSNITFWLLMAHFNMCFKLKDEGYDRIETSGAQVQLAGYLEFAWSYRPGFFTGSPAACHSAKILLVIWWLLIS